MKYAFGIWTIAVAISVSIVAAYYSIVGLTAIFAGAVIPVIIMGTALEIAKVTAAVWLHSFWEESDFLIRLYLIPAVIVLMIITSMGIFGFLSKAHIEQNASSVELVAQLERLNSEIDRQQLAIDRANNTIAGFDTQVVAEDAAIQARIDSQQAIINDIRNRLESDIDIQTSIINENSSGLTQLQAQLASIDEQRNTLAQLEQSNDIRSLQRVVGATPDGILGNETRRLVTEYKANLDSQYSNIFDSVSQIQADNKPIIDKAQEIIRELQSTANLDIQSATDAISRFREQLVSVTTQDRTADIEAQTLIISEATTQIDQLLDAKFEVDNKLRLLEVEVGPVKYIAELIYGNADPALLEQSVRWVILILVAVFDPLAVVLILAGLSILRTDDLNVSSDDTIIDDLHVSTNSVTSQSTAEPTGMESAIPQSIIEPNVIHTTAKEN